MTCLLSMSIEYDHLYALDLENSIIIIACISIGIIIILTCTVLTSSPPQINSRVPQMVVELAPVRTFPRLTSSTVR